MNDDHRLDLERIMHLVADAMALVMQGVPVGQSAATLLFERKPSARELSAARRENDEVHGAASERHSPYFKPTPVPEEVRRLGRLIDEVLAEAERQFEQTNTH